MSIHVKITSAAAKRLQLQQRRSRILSIVIACLSLILIAGIMSLFALPMLMTETPTIITYSATLDEEQNLQEKKVVLETHRKPSAPAQNMAKVIAANTEAPTAIPVPDIEVTEPSINYGDDDDFGQGWGDDAGFGGGSATFFGQQVKAQRIVYVIDYSHSMLGQREKLMREELSHSVSRLPSGIVYQMIFFSGPAWVAGDKVVQRGRNATITSGGRSYRWAAPTPTSYHGWRPVGNNLQTPMWQSTSKENIAESIKHIKTTKLTLGTVWLSPMEMALRMDPPPEVIYFMTDGLTGRSNQVATRIARLCREKGVVVNTVSLLEPKAREAMILMAERTGGQAVYIDARGRREVLRSKK